MTEIDFKVSVANADRLQTRVCFLNSGAVQ